MVWPFKNKSQKFLEAVLIYKSQLGYSGGIMVPTIMKFYKIENKAALITQLDLIASQGVDALDSSIASKILAAVTRTHSASPSGLKTAAAAVRRVVNNLPI